jgi:hypothetical protein
MRKAIHRAGHASKVMCRANVISACDLGVPGALRRHLVGSAGVKLEPPRPARVFIRGHLVLGQRGHPSCHQSIDEARYAAAPASV